MNYRKYAAIVLGVFFTQLLVSQEAVQEATQVIAVPNVSTAIGGENVSIDESAVPDFSLILPEPETDFLLTLDILDADESVTADAETLVEKEMATLSLEGIVGGGYPGYFLGDIDLSQNNEKNPFKVHFSHITQNGLGTHLPSAGYTNSETFLFGESTYIFSDQYALNMNARYETGTVGLQNKSPLFYLNAHQVVHANVGFDITTASNWNIGLFANGEWMNRYLGHKSAVFADVQSDSDAFAITTGLSFDREFSKLDFFTTLDYGFSTLHNDIANRVGFDIGLGVPMQDVSIDASVGIIYEQDLNLPVLVPFSLSFSYNSPSLELSLSGGMASEQVDYVGLQKKYPFTDIIDTITEQAQWFSAFDFNMPLLKQSSISAKVNFEKTAFDQGYLLPDFENENSVTGLYPFTLQDAVFFDTDLSFTTNHDIFGFLAGWKASWLDVLPEENAQEVYVAASVTSKNDTWGAQLSVTESFLEDYMPNIGLTAFASVSSMFQIELRLEDVVKLVSSEDRKYAGKYVTDSGFVGLFARLYL